MSDVMRKLSLDMLSESDTVQEEVIISESTTVSTVDDNIDHQLASMSPPEKPKVAIN